MSRYATLRFFSPTFVGGVAPRYQYTKADETLIRHKPPINLEQLSSGSVLGLILGTLTTKIGQLFLLSFGGLVLLGTVCALV
jgi:hypothetical protein